MDLPSKNMYDTFRDKIWKELEPLDPDWFEALTAQTLTNEGNISDQDDLCANQEGNFKIPFDKTVVDSQLFSTPKVFRHSQVVSPETDELLFAAEQEKETSPWAVTQSPYLLQEGVQGVKFGGIQPQSQDSFEVLHTPQKSSVSYAKRISESLGAEIHPDISWTSSLNTPPAIASTLILTKPDESPLPVSVCADKNVVFVRKLFPSLSNTSRVGVVSPENNDMPTVHQGVMSPEAAQNPDSHDSSQDSLNQGDCVWRQKLPDAIEDGEVRSTVASVLDGAEDVLSMFFTNSSSALRKVKTDRIKRKQIIPTKEHGCSSADISITNNATSSEQRMADREPGRLHSPIPVKTGDKGITQWSPLSLSEIPPSTVDISCCENIPKEVENNVSREQLQSDFDTGQLVRPHVKITDSGFTKKKRKFVYPNKTSKPQVQGEETQSQRKDSSQGIPDSGQEVNVKQLLKDPVEEDCCSIRENEMQNQGILTEENLPPSEEVKVLDFDISQLSRDFAQDFTQFPDPAKLSKVAEDTPHNGFSPSACLSAMKQAKQKARQANLYQHCDGVSNRRSVSSTNQSNSINEGPVSDSGFQSAVADITHVTASTFVLSSPENNRQSQPWTDFKTSILRTTPFPSTSKGNGKARLDDFFPESETDAKLSSTIKKSQPLDPGRESDLHRESISAQLSSSAKGTSDNINCIPPNGQVHGSLPEKTTVSLSSVHASGFKTASNKSIQISSTTLERAKHFFEETEGERTFCDQPIKCVRGSKDELSLSHGSVKNIASNSNQPLPSIEKLVVNSCQLTASQKADVTELCTLLEEGDSQFEFTQFKAAKLKQHCQDKASSPQKLDKELDPDFLAGIDFDDSFNLDAEKHPVKVMQDKVTVVSDGKTNRETSDVTSKSIGLLLSSAVKKENPSTEDSSSSSKHISEGTSSSISTEIEKLDTAGHTETSQLKDKNPLMLGVGFKTAGGNVLRVSEKCLSKAKALFADLEENLVTSQKSPYKQSSETELQPQHKFSVDNHAGNFLHQKEEKQKIISSKREVTGIRDEDATQGLNNSKVDTTKSQIGFQMASGKGISISEKAMQEADAFFKDCDVMDTNAGILVKHKTSIEPLSESVSHKKNFQKCKNIQRIKVNLSEKPVNEFENGNAGPATCHTEVVQHNVDIQDFNTPALTNSASFHGNSSSTAKVVIPPSSTPSKHFVSSAINELSNDGGFSTASGKKVSVSADAMKKAACLLNDIHIVEDTNKQLKQIEDASRTGRLASEIQGSTPKSGGFQTASGTGMIISSAALKKAKLLLNECDKVEDKISVKPTHSKMPVPGPPTTNSGFSTASGKKVSVSADAMKKAACLLNDIHTVEDTDKQLKQIEDASRTGHLASEIQGSTPNSGGFQTASGKGVIISSAALKKAKLLLNECDKVEDKISVKSTQSKIPVSGPPPTNSGFLAASGKPVAFSSEALQKAKSLFSDISVSAEIPAVSETKNGDKKQANAENIEEIHFGFSTAGGAKVHVSQKNMVKAKNLLKDFDDGSISAQAMQGADDFFKDCDMDNKDGMSVENRRGLASLSGIDGKNLSKFKQYQSGTVTIAEDSGNGCTEFENVIVERCENSEKMLQSDEIHKGVFKETLDSTKTVSFQGNSPIMAKPSLLCTASKNIAYSSINELSNGGGFCTASGKKVSVSDDAMTKAKSLFHENATFGDTNNQPEQKVDTVQQHNSGFQTTSGKGVAISSAALNRAKNLLSECDEVGEKISVTPAHFKMLVPGPPTMNSGFSTAGGKKVSVSADTMKKAACLLNDIHTVEDTNKQLQQIEDASRTGHLASEIQGSTPKSGGFQTASGTGMIISSASLKKAKLLLNECDKVEDKISVKPTHSKMPVSGPPPRNSGFLAASGKPVAFSSEALQKAKSLFSDISVSAEIPAVSETKNGDKKQDDAEKIEEIHFGFSTAGGAKVHVSQKNMVKAKNLLKDFANGECHDLNSYSTSPLNTHKSDQSKVKEVKDVKRPSNSNLTAASYRQDMPAKESAPQGVKSVTSLEATDYDNETLRNTSAHCCFLIKEKASTDAFKFKEGRCHDSPGEEESNVLNSDLNQTSSSEASKVKRTEESSLLNIHSLNLSDCSETQQRFLAQEALDCTKALLEDENLAGQTLSMTLENLPMQDNQKSSNRCVEEQKGKGKRLAEEPDMSGQPPLKRRLLEEFDRTVDGPRGSTLHQQISSPNGLMKDRRVFKYSTSLYPNITRPHSNGKNYVEAGLQKKPPTQHSAPGDSIAAHSKMSTFVPPFLKNAKTESRQNTALKDNIRTPSAFVPPFKKQRIIVQESSYKPQKEEDKPNHLSITPFSSNTYVPPSQKTQSTADLTGNKSKQDIQTVALADNTNDSLNNKNLSVGCGSEDSSAEASCVKGTLSGRQDMLQNLHNIELARDMQDMRIRKKKRQVIRPLPGSLFLIKTSGVSRVPLKAAVNGSCPSRCTQKQLYIHGVHQHVCEITSETAESFRFSLQHFIKQEAFLDRGGVQLADGGWLIPSNDGAAGKEEFYRALCDTPGVDPKLISEEWVYNHYRWIVWKQASMEISFPETMGSLCLTPEQVLLQLKYRYDVEVDHSRRPALRKIMEKDDTAAKTLVLCVCGVVSRGQSPKRHSFSDIKTPGADARVENPSAVVWLTDGWYAIKAQLDEPLTAMLHKGRLAVGGKLIIHGAQLVGSQDACSPLEAPDSLMLKICGNSSRPARWDAKLGYYRDPRPFLLPVSCLYSNGGPVGCVDIIILRSYPIQWMERKPDGGVVFRSVRAEEKEVRRYNSHKQKSMEALFAKIQAEFEKDEKGNNKPKRRRRTITRRDIASLQDGEELYEAVEDDPAYLEAHLSEQQLETLRAYRRTQMEKKQAELQDRYRRALENAEDREGSCPKRDVTPVWRLSIADSVDRSGSVYQLNLWRPPSDLQSLLKEGCRYKVYNLTTSDGKKHGGGTSVQLSGTKKTQFQDLQASQELLSARFQKRVSTHFVDLQNPEFQPLCGEVDLTGYVISIIDERGSSPALYLADEKLNFIKVRCFSSFAQSGLEDVVKPRVPLALSNLQLRGQSTSPTPVVYAGDLTVFSTNPKEVHLQESLSLLRNLVQGQENFFLTAEEKLSLSVTSNGLSSVSTPAAQTRTPASTTDRRQDTKTSVTFQQPVRNLGSFTPVSSRNPLATNRSTEKDPVSLKRRRALDYLSRVPSPPPLSHLGSVAYPCVKKTFNPPRRSGTPSTLKTVQTPARKPVSSRVEDEWVNDEELAMIDTQALLVGDLM